MSQRNHEGGPNIVVFGQTGAGKSSLINMLAGSTAAGVTSDLTGLNRGPESYTFWDTAGLNEGSLGTVAARQALDNLFDLAKDTSISLVVYCVRGERFTEVVRVNYDLFWGIICDRSVPIVFVVTALEQEMDMDAWWARNEDTLRGMGITPCGHACVTTTRGMNDLYKEEYEESAKKVWRLVRKHCATKPWRMTPEWRAEVTNRMDAYTEKYNARSGQEGELLWQLFLQAVHWLRRWVLRELPSNFFATPNPVNPVTHNIILFGETGSGKSSIVNMIVGRNVATVSNDPISCTFQNERYECSINDRPFRIYDTSGLNEGDQGQSPHWKAVANLYALIQELDGVSLLIYCFRGKIIDKTRANWNLFNKVVCGEQVPIILVVTGLEHEADWDDLARRKRTRAAFEGYGMKPKEVACIISTRGRNGEYADLYRQSQVNLFNLVEKCHKPQPWVMRKEERFQEIYEKLSTSRFLSSSSRTEGNMIDKFVSATGMSGGDSNMLKTALLSAEKEPGPKRVTSSKRVMGF